MFVLQGALIAEASISRCIQFFTSLLNRVLIDIDVFSHHVLWSINSCTCLLALYARHEFSTSIMVTCATDSGLSVDGEKMYRWQLTVHDLADWLSSVLLPLSPDRREEAVALLKLGVLEG